MAQSVEETRLLAGEHIIRKDYKSAIKLYRRCLFFTPETDTAKPYLYAGIAEAFLLDGTYANAAENFGKAVFLSSQNSEWKCSQIKAYLLAHNYNDAKRSLVKIDTSANPQLTNQSNFYWGLTYFGEEKYDSAYYFFSKTINNPKKQDQMSRLFRKANHIKYRSRTTAIILSVLIPGAGQVYAGDINRGINSFLLTSAFVVLGYNTYLAYGITETMISVFPWYVRYYGYGIKNAGQLAVRKQEQKQQEILNNIFQLIPAK